MNIMSFEGMEPFEILIENDGSIVTDDEEYVMSAITHLQTL